MPADYFDVLFDGPPGPESCRFVEVESPAGVGAKGIGEWIDRGDGYWALRFPLYCIKNGNAATPKGGEFLWCSRHSEGIYEGVPIDPVEGCPQRKHPHDHVLCRAAEKGGRS